MRRILNRSFFLGAAAGGVITLVGLILLAILLKDAGRHTLRAQMKPPLPPAQAEAFYDWDLTSVDGDAFALSELKGRVVFLTLWSPDCPYCVAQLPLIQKLSDLIAGEGVEFVLVCPEKYRDKAVDKADLDAIRLPLYTYSGELPETYKHHTTPATFILDADGMVAWAHEGPARWDDEATVHYLRGLLIKRE